MGQTHAVSTFSTLVPGGGAGARVCINAMEVDAARSASTKRGRTPFSRRLRKRGTTPFSLAVRARRIAFVNSGARAGEFVAARPGVSRHVQAGVVVDPVDQAVLENRVRSRDAVRNRERISDLARRLRYGDVNRAQTVTIPGREYEILEDRRIVILLRHAPPRLAARLGNRLIEAFFNLIVGN